MAGELFRNKSKLMPTTMDKDTFAEITVQRISFTKRGIEEEIKRWQRLKDEVPDTSHDLCLGVIMYLRSLHFKLLKARNRYERQILESMRNEQNGIINIP